MVAPWPVPFSGERPTAQPNFAARRILCVARLEPHKNHLRLLEACEALWKEGLAFELHLIGCLAYPDTAWKILRRLRRLKHSGRPLTWQAHVDEPGLHQAYRDCSFTAFPSLREGFGLPILESLWHRRPVVCGANGALGEVAAGGGCLPVDTQNVDSIAAGLRSLLQDEPAYNAIGADAQNRSFGTWADYWREGASFCQAPVAAASVSRLSTSPRG